MDSSIDLSAVILTWNSGKYIRRCIESLVLDASGSSLDYEIFVVDNGSRDNTKDVLEELSATYKGKLTPIYLPKNFGTTVSRNIALKRVSGRFICLMDSDAYTTAGCLKRLVSTLERHPEIGIVAPRLLYPDGRYQKSSDTFPTFTQKLLRVIFLRKFEASEAQPPEGPVDCVISALWIMKKDLLNHVGFFDESFFYAPEDIDYCFRTSKAGYTVYYLPDAVAFHDAHERSRSVSNPRFIISHLYGLFIYFFKHSYFKKNYTSLMN